MATKREEKLERLGEVQKILDQAGEQAGDEFEFEAVTCLGDDLTPQEKANKYRALAKEHADLARECKKLEFQEMGERVQATHEEMERPAKTIVHSAASDRKIGSVGRQVVESEQYAAFVADHTKGFSMFFEEVELKTLMSTTSGWAPDSDRTGRTVEAVTRPIQVLDLIPVADTDSNSVTYWEETLRTHSAAEKLEAAAYAESAFEWTERVSQVRKITDSIPATDEQLQDRSQVRSLLEQRLGFGVRQRLDNQVLNGTGVPPLLEGILNVAGIQTQAKGADPTFDAIRKAITKVRLTGRAMPNAIVVHPNDWQEIRLTRTADGMYIMAHPAQVGPMTLFGLPIVEGDVIAEGTALVGDFANFCRLYDRRGLSIEVGYVNDDFAKGKRTIRADMRAAFVVERPQAFCTVTGI